ncbi:MAG TPA: ABC transporter permease [Gaiellaceae bacterium]|nr:ABC transporter permease [Gaiellaceae bacterium]
MSLVDWPEAAPPPARPLRRRAAGAGRAVSVALALVSRLGWLLLVVWAAVSLTFVLSRVVPADPARLAAGLQAGPEQVAEVRRALGLDQPVWEQYGRYLSGIVRLDLGDSVQTRRPVLDDVLRYLPATLELVITAFVLYAVLGIALGTVWAMRPRGSASKVIGLTSIAGAAVPVFWIALVLQLIFGYRLGWFPISGTLDYFAADVPRRTGFTTLDAILAGNGSALADALRHMALPVTALIASQLAVATRLTRSSMAAELRRPYVRAARARGATETRIVLVDALRNALNPVITVLGLQFGWLLGGTILVEVVFSWPGLGLYAFNSFRTFDYNPILALTIITTVTFVIVNELVGLLYPLLDPRLKEAG